MKSGLLSRARSDIQALHYRITVTTSGDHAAIRLHLQDIAERTRVLSDELKAAIEALCSGTHRDLRDVVTLLDAASRQSGNLANSSKSDLCEVSRSARAIAATAVRILSQAVANERCKDGLSRNFDSLHCLAPAWYRRLIITLTQGDHSEHSPKRHRRGAQRSSGAA